MQDIIDTLFTILWYVINYLLFYVIIRTAHNLVMSSDCSYGQTNSPKI